MKATLICGVSGQDGSYLAQLLLSKGYRNGTDLIILAPRKMPYDLEESKSGGMIYAESWAGGIA